MDGDMVDGDTADGDTDGEMLDGDATERASEIDDMTDSMPRPTGGHAEHTAEEMSAETGDGDVADVDDDGSDDDSSDVDYSDVDVEQLLTEREEFRGLAQRVQADFDNYRKRATAQAQVDADRAAGRLAEALLPVLDAAEAAYLRHPDEIGPLLNQMLSELKKQGLENLDLEGRPFDPEVAEAVAHESGEGDEPVVAEVLRSGYTWKGRVLRPAMVKTKD